MAQLRNNLLGKRFGRLVVLLRAASGKNRATRYLCECDCGKRTIVYSTALVQGDTTSCGCRHSEVARSPKTDLRGWRFGMLRVIELAAAAGKRNTHYLCQCECGQLKTIASGNLTSGHTTSCGCKGKRTHAQRKTIAFPLGKRYGRLVVLEYAGRQQGMANNLLLRCQCDCGKIHIARASSLQSGITRSCGCYRSQLVSLDRSTRYDTVDVVALFENANHAELSQRLGNVER